MGKNWVGVGEVLIGCSVGRLSACDFDSIDFWINEMRLAQPFGRY
jgi:hypothetical protein